MPTPGPGATVYIKFTTRAVTTGIPTSLSGGVISIYKDASLTQSTTGVSLTADFDSVVGLNHVSINTAADGTFYSSGSTFYLVITTGTVGGTSVIGEVVGEFDLAPSIASQVWDEVNTGATHNITNSTGKQLRTITTNTGVIYTGTAPSQAGMTSTQIKLDAGASAVPQAYQWDVISIISGAGAGQSAVITSYNATTKVATVDSPWTVQPDNTSVFEITPTAQVQVISYLPGQDPGSLVLVTAANKLATSASGGVTLADGVAHGGTPGSSTATLAMQAVNVTNPSGVAVTVHYTGVSAVNAMEINADAGSGGALYIKGGGFGMECLCVGVPGGGFGLGAMVLSSNPYGTPGLAVVGGGPGVSISSFADDSNDGDGIIVISQDDGTGTHSTKCMRLMPSSTGDGGVSVFASGTDKKALLLSGASAHDAMAIATGAGTPVDIFDDLGNVHTLGGGVDPAVIAAAVWDEVNTAATHNVDNSTGKQLRAVGGNSITIYSSILPSQSGVPANQVKLDAGASSSNGAYVGAAMWVVSGSGQGGGVCTSYIGSTRQATIHTNWAIQPVATDVVEVVPTGISTVAGYITGQDPATLVWNAPVRTLTDFGFTVTVSGLPPIPNNWITSLGINAGALNGKGDWLTTKTGYSLDLTQAIPSSNGLATMGDALNSALSMGFGNQIVDASAKTLTMYQRNGNVVVKTFNLDSATAPKTRT